MADWYVSSVAHAAVTQWAASTAYSVGALRRQLATPTVGNERVFRCTTAGTSGGSEPAWTLTKGGTTNDGTAVWTEVTGNSTYAWSAAHARLRNVATWAAAGDRIFIASNSAETQASASWSATWPGTTAAPIQIVSVNPAGSTPPVGGDVQAGASVTTTTTGEITLPTHAYVYGITWTSGGSSGISAANNQTPSVFENCTFNCAGASFFSAMGSNSPNNEFINCTLTFSDTGAQILNGLGHFIWRGGSIGGATVPTTLVSTMNNTGPRRLVFDSVDLSAFGSGKTLVGTLSTNSCCVDFINCKLGSSLTITATPTGTRSRVTLQNCDSSGTGYRNEIYDYSGTLTTETTIVRSSGASDGTQAVSWKVVTTAKAGYLRAFEAFPIGIWNDTTGGAKTFTVEILTDGVTLKDNEIWLEAHELATSGAPLATVASTSSNPLAAGANVTTSSATWTTTGLSSPVKQKLAVTFTPQIKGFVRLLLKVAKASTTVYVDPKVTIS